ncbi:MAG: hypothetical protein PF590_08750, partial [Candidatus Delongbacteria bacterium]|nr:hypothetical protein [Candidatus Delongbacteria bacterium]
MKTSIIFTVIALAITMNLNAETPVERNTYPSANASVVNAFKALEEENIEVSSWMLDIAAFETEYVGVDDWMFDVNAFAETSMAVEEWMFNESLFTDYEKNIELEDWM